MNSGPCKAAVVFLTGADPKNYDCGPQGAASPDWDPAELRPEAEDGPQSPLFQSRNVYFAYFYKEGLSQQMKSTNCRPTVSHIAIWTQFKLLLSCKCAFSTGCFCPVLWLAGSLVKYL